MKKQLQLITCAIFMVLVSLIGYGQNEGDEFDFNGIKYKITSKNPDNEVVVIDYIGSATEVEILETVNNNDETYTVTAIGPSAFFRDQLTSVTIPETVISIGDEAFDNNQLTSVTIPNGVTSIGKYAFWDNELTEVIIPNSVTSIQAYAFGKNNLTEVTIPNGVTSIQKQAFTSNSLTKVTIPNSVTSIESGAFANNSLTEVTIPDGVTHIGNWAFAQNQFTEVIIPDSVTHIGEWAFRNNQLGSVTIPDGITSIASHTFRGNNLTEVTISSTVTSIGSNAFEGNPDLNTVTVKAINLPTLYEDAFTGRGNIDLVVPKDKRQVYLDNNDWTGFKSITEVVEVNNNFTADYITYKITALTPPKVTATGYDKTAGGPTVNIPETVSHGPNNYTVTSIGNNAFDNKQLTSVTIGENVESIRDNAFRNNALSSVTLPNSVTSIGNSAFNGNNLSSVTIGENVTSIGAHAFRNNALSSVTLPNSVTSIGNTAFYNNQLTSVTLPNSLTSIAGHTFRNNALTNVTIPNSVTSIGNSAFSDNQLTSVTIGENVTSIGAHAFWNNALSSVTLPNSVTSIGNSAFRYNALSSVTLPNSLTSIAGHTFRNNALTNVTIPNSVTSIGNSAFSDNQLTSVTIGENVTSIGAHAFWNNALSSVTLPNSVTSIGNSAFRYNALSSVTLPNSLTSIAGHTFRNNALTNVTIPNSVTSIGNNAFYNNQLTSVTIGASVVNIGDSTFFGNPPLTTVVLRAHEPPALGNDAFQGAHRPNMDVIVPRDAIGNYVPAWNVYGFKSITEEVGDGGSFTFEGITYEVTALGSTNTVTITGNTNTGDLIIPGNVSHGPNDFEVTGIGEEAFKDNQLTSVTIGENVKSIGDSAFRNTPLILVLSRTNTPPGLATDAFTNPGNIRVIVPKGNPAGSTKIAYETAWGTGFNSITEGIQVSIDAPAETANLLAFPVTFQFDLGVTGFTQEDINVVNATVVDGSFSQVNDSMYTVEITPEPGFCEGTITIDVSENVAEYTPNFLNLAASATVTVNAIPSKPEVSSPSVEYCVGETATALTATGDNILWYTDPTGETGDANAPTPTTTTAGSTSYYISQTINGCESERTVIVVTVNALPEAPTISSNTPVCSGENAVFTITGTPGNIVTYGGASSGTATIETDGTVEVTVSEVNSDATINLTEITNGSCSVPLTETATVTVNALPVAPTVSSSTIEYCVGEMATALTATGDNILWYTDPTGETGDVNAPTPTTTTAGSTTYYVSQTNENGCEGERAEIVVVVNAPPAPEVNSPVVYCVGVSAEALTATGTNLLWYTTPIGGPGTHVAPVPNTATVGSISFYVSQTNENGCEGERAKIVVMVNPRPVAPTVSSSPVEYCVDETANALTASGTDLLWYTTPTGGTRDATAPIPSTATAGKASYYVSQTTNGCESERAEIVVSVRACAAQTGDGFTVSGKGHKTTAAESQVLTAVSNNEINDITVYPNPARDKVYIDLGSGQALKQVNIRTITGAYLYSENGLEINTSRLSEGIYLFEIVTKTGDRSIKRVIIQ